MNSQEILSWQQTNLENFYDLKYLSLDLETYLNDFKKI